MRLPKYVSINNRINTSVHRYFCCTCSLLADLSWYRYSLLLLIVFLHSFPITITQCIKLPKPSLLTTFLQGVRGGSDLGGVKFLLPYIFTFYYSWLILEIKKGCQGPPIYNLESLIISCLALLIILGCTSAIKRNKIQSKQYA